MTSRVFSLFLYFFLRSLNLFFVLWCQALALLLLVFSSSGACHSLFSVYAEMKVALQPHLRERRLPDHSALFLIGFLLTKWTVSL